jgi:hydrophobe/amphiphile efflux-1 (HAE1) family protein
VNTAITAQNAQVSAGQLGALPATSQPAAQRHHHRAQQAADRGPVRNVVLKAAADGAVVRLRDVARVELGAENLTVRSILSGKPGAGLGVIAGRRRQRREGGRGRERQDRRAAAVLPEPAETYVSFDTTPFVSASIEEVVKALAEAMLLVVLVMYVFLQNLRATLIPAIAVPVVLLGTFGVLSVFGYSINTLTMFGMVLAIGLLVDDAIVVVENVERVMSEEGLSPQEATKKSMAEITPALVGIALVLSAVFIPMAFFGGSTGVIYRQFSITIVSAMVLSVLVALTLTPALCATLLKPVAKGDAFAAPRAAQRPVRLRTASSPASTAASTAAPTATSASWAASCKRGKRSLLVYALICAAMAVMFLRLPTSFLPDEDQGFVQVQITLPPGSSNARLQPALNQVQDYFGKQPEVTAINLISGQNGDQSSARAFVKLKDWAERPGKDQTAAAIARRASKDLADPRRARLRDAAAGRARPGRQRRLQLLPEGPTAAGPRRAGEGARPGAEAGARSGPNWPGAQQQPGRHARVRRRHRRRAAGALSLATNAIDSTLSTAMGGTYVNDFLNKGRVKKRLHAGRHALPHAARTSTAGACATRWARWCPSRLLQHAWTYGSPQLSATTACPAYEFVGDAAPA